MQVNLALRSRVAAVATSVVVYGTVGFGFVADDGAHLAPRREALSFMSSVPHPKRELLKLCARIGYTPH